MKADADPRRPRGALHAAGAGMRYAIFLEHATVAVCWMGPPCAPRLGRHAETQPARGNEGAPQTQEQGCMPGMYRVTLHSRAGYQGRAGIGWLDHSAHAYVTTVATMSV